MPATFSFAPKDALGALLPQLFSILRTNMTAIDYQGGCQSMWKALL